MFLLVLALAPVAGLIVYFYHKDKYEKEPLGLLIKAFMCGVFVTFVAMFLEMLVALLSRSFLHSPIMLYLMKVFVQAGIVEEGCKYLVFMLLIYHNKEFNEPYDGILYAVMISLGFAALENVMYVYMMYFKTNALSAISTGFGRAFFAVPMHALVAVFMGYSFGMAKFLAEDPRKEKECLVNAFVIPAALHGFYDLFAMSRTPIKMLFLVVLLFLCWVFTCRAIKIQVSKSPFKRSDEES